METLNYRTVRFEQRNPSSTQWASVCEVEFPEVPDATDSANLSDNERAYERTTASATARVQANRDDKLDGRLMDVLSGDMVSHIPPNPKHLPKIGKRGRVLNYPLPDDPTELDAQGNPVPMFVELIWCAGKGDQPDVWMQRFCVTANQYGRFAKVTNRPWSPPEWCKGDHPAVEVSWYDSMAFAKWAGLSLPTEKEWQHCAEGPEKRTYPWGNEEPDDTRLWWSATEWRDKTAEVNKHPAGQTPEGIEGMAGNVWEWCLTEYV